MSPFNSLSDPRHFSKTSHTETTMKIRKDNELGPRTIAASFPTVRRLRELIGDTNLNFVVSATHKDEQVTTSPDIFEELSQFLLERY